MNIDSQPMQTCNDLDFLELLAGRDIHVRVREGKLRIDAPAGAVDALLKSELVRRKQGLLSLLTAQSAPAQERDERFAPLSYAQERLWLLERFHPGNYAYNIPESFLMHTVVDRALMQRAIDFVVQRHAVLRTSIAEDAHGAALQQIHAQVTAPLQFVDLQRFTGPVKQERLERTVRGLSREPFDLRVAPLVRFFLIQLEADTFVAFINMHHIVSDRWSTRVLYRELIAAYTLFAQGNEPALPALPLQYADYARRERNTALDFRVVPGARTMQEQLQYWKKQLANAPDLPELPFRLKPAVFKPFDGATFPLTLTEEDTVGIRALARQQNASPYMVLLAALSALLFRYAGATDVCIGSPVSERTTTDTEGLIGLFVNTLVMRCNVSDEVSFMELLRSVRETVLDAQANHDIPLQRILREVQPERAASQPLFQIMLGFDAFMGGEAKDGKDGEIVSVDPGFAKFEMTLQMYEQRDRINGWIEYRTDLFTAESIQKFGHAFVLLLRGAIREPDKRISKLAIMDEQERTRLLQTWNATAADFPHDQTIHRLFEQQVKRTPEATALVDGVDRITYAELNSRANRIAHGLISLELPPESIVGIHLSRNAEMVAALLGILKAGAAYLPLDKQYPEERLRAMLEDSGCTVVLSHATENLSMQARMYTPDFPSADTVKLDRNPDMPVSPASLAYVIYTSGSTGRPKGVAIEHHSTVSFLSWAMQTFSPEALRGTLASTSISFDLSVFEIFVPLVSGHTVILASDVLAFPALPSAAEVTLVTTVPSAASALITAGDIPKTVHTMNLAGEALSTRLVDRLYRETSIVDVNDLYGPTETTTYSTWNRRFPGKAATIGRPLSNTRVYLVDPALEIVPEGVPGELFIAGEGVARGYLGNPELTREKFVQLQHLGEAGRAYRTGDLCRYQADGILEYLGRFDTQVKVRGFRIEVAEVEAVLMRHPAVREAVVTVQTDGDAGASLVAYVLLADEAVLDTAALIAHQSLRLPAYMVARKLAALEAFPRTANGKIDRKQLGVLQLSNASSKPGSAPRDALEAELIAIWQKGFDLSTIGIDDDFFQLGGHSLLALRIFAEIEAKLGQRMMLSVLFQAPTIRLLAEEMRTQKRQVNYEAS